MPVATYNKEYLLKRLGFKIDEKSLVRNIQNIGINVEEINDNEITIEVQANRPDLIGVVGLVRAIRYFMRRSRSFGYKMDEDSEAVISVGKRVSSIRPYISGMIVENMDLTEDDLKDIINFTEKISITYGRQREKIAMGLHDLKNVEQPFLYDAFDDESFVPLNRNKPMKYSEVLKIEDKGKRYGTLGASERSYVALKDKKGTMSLIPILNSERTKVSTSTKNMLVDITGKSKEVIEGVADLIAANFIDMGYKVRRIAVNYGGRQFILPKMARKEFSIPLGQVDNEIGVIVGFNNAILLANKMGYEAALVGRRITVLVPPYRLDVINEQDVVEDIAVAYGYDYIQPIAIPTTQQGTLEEKSRVLGNVSQAMIGLGFSESLNSYLTNEESNFTKMRESRHEHYVSIANPKAETITMLRTSVLPSLLKQLGQSMHDKLPLKLFEIDLAFDIKNTEPEESHHLAAVGCYPQSNFNDIKAAFAGLANKMGFVCEMEKAESRSFIEGRCASVKFNKKSIGFLGELHPEVLTSFRIEEPVVAFEIDLASWLSEKNR